MADSGTSNDDPGGSSTNIMTESDKDKYHHLSKYYELIKITAGKGKPRNLFFKCLQPGPECSTGRAKSCQEGSMSNLLRHYERVHPHLAKDFKTVFLTKLKRAADNSKGAVDPKQPKIDFFFKSNCTRDQLNGAIVDHIIDSMGPFTLAEEESFQKIIQLLDPNKKSGGPAHKTVTKIMVCIL